MRQVIFDTHIHYPEEGLLGIPYSPYQKNHLDELDRLVRVCEDNNIVRACLLGGYNGLNDFVLDATKRFPSLFIPMAVINMDAELPESIDRLHGAGFRGLKIIGTHKNYDDAEYFPFYERAKDNRMVVLFHTGVLGGIRDYSVADAKNPDEQSLQFEKVLAEFRTSSVRMRSLYLDTIAMAIPDLKIIGAHLGYGEYDLSCAVARWRRNVYFDISGGDTVRRHILEGGYIKKEILPDKLTFGTDSSIDRMSREVSEWLGAFEGLGLSEDEIDKIMYRNAAYLFEL